MSVGEARKREYARWYSTGHARTGQPVHVPEDVQRLESHEPCLRCGQARGPCDHRPWMLR
jgi:hypothetical protein